MNHSRKTSVEPQFRSQVERLEDRFLFAGDLDVQIGFGEYQPPLNNSPTAVAGLLEAGLGFDLTSEIDDRYLVAWSSANFNGDWKAVARQHLTHGAPNGPLFVIGDFPADTEIPQIQAAALDDDSYVVVWSDDNLLQGSRIDRFGKVSETQVLLSANNINELNLTPSKDGGFFVSWIDKSTSQATIRGQLFDVENNLVGDELIVAVSATDSTFADLDGVEIEDTALALEWSEIDSASDEAAHFLQLIDLQGNFLQSNSISVSTAGTISLDVAVSTLGDFAAVYQSINDGVVEVYLDLFDATGVLQHSEVLATGPIDLAGANSTISVIDDGFVVGYAKQVNGDKVGFFARQYNNSAVRIGPEVQVSDAVFDTKLFATSQLNDGAFAASWIGFDEKQTFPVLFTNTMRLGKTPVEVRFSETLQVLLSGNEIVSITGLPEGTGLSSGTMDSPGIWRVRVDEVDELQLVGKQPALPLALQFDVISGGQNLVQKGFSLGSDADDNLADTPLDDHVVGGAGVDVFVVPGVSTDYRITKRGNGSYSVVKIGDFTHEDILEQVELIRFDDRVANVRTSPSIITFDTMTLEDTEIPIPIHVGPNSLHPTETKIVILKGIPNGFSIRDGVHSFTSHGESIVDISDFALEQLVAIPPMNDDRDIVLEVVATIFDAELNQSSTVSDVFLIEVLAMTDGSIISAADSFGSVDQPIPILIESRLLDNDGSEIETLLIGGLPDSAILSAGTKLDDGNWRLETSELLGLMVLPNTIKTEETFLTVTSIVSEVSTDKTSISTVDFRVRIDLAVPEPPEEPVPEEPVPEPPSPVEPEPVPEEPEPVEPSPTDLLDRMLDEVASSVADQVFSTEFGSEAEGENTFGMDVGDGAEAFNEAPMEASDSSPSQSEKQDSDGQLLSSDDFGLSLSGDNDDGGDGFDSGAGASTPSRRNKARAAFGQYGSFDLQSSADSRHASFYRRTTNRLSSREFDELSNRLAQTIRSTHSNEDDRQANAVKTIFVSKTLGVAANFDADQLWSEADAVEQKLIEDIEIEDLVVGTAVIVATGYSIAHITWLLRSGLLATKLMSSFPIWGTFDFLRMLNDDLNAGESLADIVTAT